MPLSDTPLTLLLPLATIAQALKAAGHQSNGENCCANPDTGLTRLTHWLLPPHVIRCVYTVLFEWDAAKNEVNMRKHGVSFEIASEVFDDRYLLIEADRTDETGEQRYTAIGAVWHPLLSAVLLVIHVYREYTNGEEIIRIISARKADKNDIRRYQEQAMD